MADSDPRAQRDWSDWSRNRRSYLLAWGLPSALLIIGIFLPAPVRTMVWSGALVWKGAACIANAARCGRTHCHLTGPFFLAMAVVTLAHGSGAIALGSLGWWWIGITIVVGNVALWLVPERLFGKFLTSKRSR